MRKIVILGAGFGGLTSASELNPSVSEDKLSVALIDSNSHFSMGFNMQWVLAGRRSAEEGQRPYSNIKARNVRFIHDEIIKIDTEGKRIHTKSHRIEYDQLIIALGAELAPELVPGLSNAGYNLCNLASILQMKTAIQGMREGTLLIMI